MFGWIRGLAVSQEKIVFLAAIALFIVFSVFLRGFLTSGNLITLVRGVSTLGILGVGMAIVVIGRGVDLTIVAIYAMSAAWTLHLAGLGVSIPAAMLLGFLLALTVGADQWRADCLCRDPGAVRHARHGATGLWLRSLRSRSALRRLYAPQRQRHRVDRWRLHCGHADADSVFRVDSAALVLRSCASPSRGGSFMRSATISLRRAIPARRCARSSFCNTSCPHRSPMSPA